MHDKMDIEPTTVKESKEEKNKQQAIGVN